jgi:putative transcriptional regulator
MIKFPHDSNDTAEAPSLPAPMVGDIHFDDALSLKNRLLVAMPAVDDPNFSHSVTYVCEHSDQGAMGITINRQLADLSLGDVLDHMKISCSNPQIRQRPIYVGGPVSIERGFVLHSPHGGWESTLEVTEEVGLTTSRDILQAMAEGAGPARAIIALGYSGWAEGQLEQELADNTWLTVDGTPSLIFDTPMADRWRAAAQSLGVDMHLIAGEAGHA